MEYIKALFVFVVLAIFCALSGCGENEEPDNTAVDLLLGISEFNEGNSDRNISLNLNLSEETSQSVSFQYSLQDGTARSGIDYLSSSGSLTFSPGMTTGTVEIGILSDTDIELNKYFTITFTSNETPSRSYDFNIYIINDDYNYIISEDAEGFITPSSYPGMNMVWSDDFDGSGLDIDSWTFETGDGCDRGVCGWGNNELEVYTNSERNVFLENGRLIIKVTEDGPCNCYESGRIITQDKREFKYGRIDIRAKITEGQGIWPALWMLGENINDVGWPVCGEIDIMENIGSEPNKVHGTVHYDAGGYKSSSGSTTSVQKFSEKFHVYTILWDADKITWYVDYVQFKTFTKSMAGSSYPFNNNFFFILNVAVGGNWPGSPDASTVFPQQMEVDYIRVFQ